MESNKGRKKKEIGFDSPFATRLRELLAETNTTQPTLAAAVGVSRQAVGQWKDGNTVPDILDFQKIADYFKVSTDYLLGRSDVRSLDTGKRAVSELTGLSEQCIDILNTSLKSHDNKSICKLTSSFVVELCDKNYFLNKILCIIDITSSNKAVEISDSQLGRLIDTANRCGCVLLERSEAIEYHGTKLNKIVVSAAEAAFQKTFEEWLHEESGD